METTKSEKAEMNPTPKPGTPLPSSSLPWRIVGRYGENGMVIGDHQEGATRIAGTDTCAVQEVFNAANAAYIVHAANELPKLEAERDSLKQSVADEMAFSKELCAERERLYSQRHNLQARIKELEEALRNMVCVHSGGYPPTEKGNAMIAARAALNAGNERSKS
jgi:hypothetical protein